jgi:hypothetical protein
MKLTATYIAPRVNLEAYRRALQETLGDAIARAAAEWLNATTGAIPVWSGASLATFLPLASELSFPLSIAPTSFVSRINLGLSNATGEVETNAQTGRYTFTYGTTLKHLIYNEFNNANVTPDPSLFARLISPGPYQFQQKGKAAFEKAANGVQLPAPIFVLNRIQVK